MTKSIILCLLFASPYLIGDPCSAEQGRSLISKSVATKLLDFPGWFGDGVSNQNIEQFISNSSVAYLSGTWEDNRASCLRANPEGKPEEDRGTYVCHGYDTSWGKERQRTCKKLDNGSFECTATYPNEGDQVCSMSQSRAGELDCCRDYKETCKDRNKECFYSRDESGRPSSAICNFFPSSEEESKRCQYTFGDDGSIVEETCDSILTNGKTSFCLSKYEKGAVVSTHCVFWDVDGKVYSMCSFNPINKLEECVFYKKDDNVDNTRYTKTCPDGSLVTVRVKQSKIIESCAQPKGKPNICYLPSLDITCREPDKEESRIICLNSKPPEKCFVIDKSTGNTTDIDQSSCELHRRYLKAQVVKTTLDDLWEQSTIDSLCKDIGAIAKQ